MKKKVVGIVIGSIVLIVLAGTMFIKNVYISNSILDFDYKTGSITIPDETQDWSESISRNDCIQISKHIEKYIKDKYELNVKVDKIEITDSRSSAMGIASSGYSPAVIGTAMSITFEENDYISSLHESQNVLGIFRVENMDVSFKTVSREKNVAFSEKIEEYMKQEYGEALEVKGIDIYDVRTYYCYNISFADGSWGEFNSSNYKLMDTKFSLKSCDFNNISRDKNIEFSEKVERNIEENYGVKLEIAAIEFSVRNESRHYWYKFTFSDGSTIRYDSSSDKLFEDIELDGNYDLYISRDKNIEFSQKVEKYIKQNYSVNKNIEIRQIRVRGKQVGLEYIFDLDCYSGVAILRTSNYILFDTDDFNNKNFELR